MGIIGYLLAFGAYLWANVKRKKRDIEVLSLLGINRRALVLFPVGQSVVTACVGIIIGATLAVGVSLLLNALFSERSHGGELVCQLQLGHILIGAGATIVFSIVSSLQAVRLITEDAEINVAEII